MFSQVDADTNIPTNSSVFALMATAVWFLYFYLSNLACVWTGPFVFDPTELPIITLYLMYMPMYVQWMRKETDLPFVKRFLFPILALCGSTFMVLACILGHGMACLWYMIVFAVVMAIGAALYKSKK